jgi:hypothetical protein
MCSSNVSVTGAVIATNGVALPTPIEVVSGQVRLGVGVHTIRWTASDGKLNTQATQTVTIGTQIESSQSFVLENAASLRFGTGYAALYNAGNAIAKLNNDAHTSDIFSVGAVDVEHRAYAGNIRSATSTFVQPDGHAISQTVGPVALPALPTLPSFTVPGGSGITVNTSRTLTPGSYASVTANSGATLIFSGGDFYIGSLTINSSVTLRAAANTRIFVKTGLAFRSSFTTPSNQIQPVCLGFAGTSATFEAIFNGTLLAPNATITFGLNSPLTFTGSFYAKVLWLRPNNQLICIES